MLGREGEDKDVGLIRLAGQHTLSCARCARLLHRTRVSRLRAHAAQARRAHSSTLGCLFARSPARSLCWRRVLVLFKAATLPYGWPRKRHDFRAAEIGRVVLTTLLGVLAGQSSSSSLEAESMYPDRFISPSGVRTLSRVQQTDADVSLCKTYLMESIRQTKHWLTRRQLLFEPAMWP